MTDTRAEAPVFVQTFALAQWICVNVDAAPPLGRTLHLDALGLLDQVVLALKGRDRSEQLHEADTLLVLVRVHLRLAEKTGIIEEQQLVFLLGELDSIGRQLGGWQRRLQTDNR